MGKLILIAVTAASLTGAIMLHSMHGSTTAAEREINKYRSKEHARNAAKAAYARAKRYVWSKWSTGQIEFEETLAGTYEPATYEAEIVSRDTANRARADITITGQFDHVRVGNTHEIDAVFESPTLGSVPKALQYAIMTDGSLDLSGTMSITSDSAALNADVHTNQELGISGAPNSVDGFGTYTGSKAFSPPWAESTIFQPNTNPDGESSVQQTGAVDVPSFNPADYTSKAHKTTGDIDWSGTKVVDFTTLGPGLGTEQNPAIWYVNGDVDISGAVTVKGYGLFVVTGAVHISGGATTSQASVPPGWMGLYADGDINISGNTQIHGQLFNNGNVSISGTPHIYGNVTSGGETSVSGTPDLVYKPADPALTTPIWGGNKVTGLMVDAYTEW